MSNDEPQVTLNGVLHHFAELVRILDGALAKAERVNDVELIDRLRQAKAAAEHSNKLVGELRDMLPATNQEGHASSSAV